MDLVRECAKLLVPSLVAHHYVVLFSKTRNLIQWVVNADITLHHPPWEDMNQTDLPTSFESPELESLNLLPNDLNRRYSIIRIFVKRSDVGSRSSDRTPFVYQTISIRLASGKHETTNSSNNIFSFFCFLEGKGWYYL